MKYSCAGVLFTNGTHVLGGYQPKKDSPCISGIGGKRELRDTSFLYTGLREFLEEIFAIEPLAACPRQAKDDGGPNPSYIELIQEHVTPLRIVELGGYINIVYSFNDLETILVLLNANGATSSLYYTFPLTLNDLIFTRKITDEQEITHLALLPRVSSHGDGPFVGREFIKDMRYI
jgi:hypothetical protein